jgi:hypothetical protein
MDNLMMEIINGDDRFSKIARDSYLEYGDVLDFIWKVPNFIQHETKLEITQNSKI